MNISWRRWTACFVVLGLGTGCFATADAQELLLRDDFDDSGIVDPSVWRLPFGSEGTFVGRTQYRGDAATDMPLQGIAEPAAASGGSMDGLVTEIHLNTYSPIDPGNQFLGTDLLTKRNFARAGGLTIEARMRLKPTTAGGLVGGFFLFDVTRDSPPGADNLVRDEIDWELISNQAVGGTPTQDPFSNYWDEGPFTGAGAGGDGEFHDVAGFDLTDFNDYKIEWTPNAIKWSINDTVVRTVTSSEANIPDDPMKLHFNIWAPADDFADAYNAGLIPEGVLANDTEYTVQIDHVEVNRINTTNSANMLSNPSFEGSDGLGSLDDWTTFGNVFLEANDPFDGMPGLDDPNIPDSTDGTYLAKAFGPFPFPFTPGTASGLSQSAPASPGDEFEASIDIITPGGDSIIGTENFNLLQLRFLDSGGNVIEEAFADPGNLVQTNSKDFPLLDGRDPNAESDVFYTGVVNAIAPAGTAEVEYSLFFIQLLEEGGAAWYDNASLVLLTPDTVALPGDFNEDGIVDAADYAMWRNNLGSPVGTLGPNDTTGLAIGTEQYDLWRANYGSTAGAGSGAATVIPEPGSLLLVLSLTALAGFRRAGRRRSGPARC